ncbi:MAG TPA: hypothetical protein VFR78_14805 [Pyrinomonadaceae bacterium]|nr:hypothetical protein [Pyrinomonadaceae bacterium]
MKRALLLVIVFVSATAVGEAQSNNQQLLQLQEAEVTKLTTSAEQLRQLYSEGLIARIELEKAENALANAKAGVEETRAQIAAAEKLAVEQKKAAALARVKPLVKTTSMALNRTPVVMRSTSGNWSLAHLSMVQQFFTKTFGRALPTSTIGQSATHNRMGWDHRHAVDVGLHPDSVEGRALINFLQSAGIPYLAFRGAVPGVSTGPHIHIGQPSHRI